MKHIFDDLIAEQFAQGKHLCVGLDPDFAKMPPEYLQPKMTVFDSLTTFCIESVGMTAPSAACFKPNLAFFVAHDTVHDPIGTRALHTVCSYIAEKYPDIPIILDAKDADIGNTNNGYLKRAIALAHAITLNPYLGETALRPLLDSHLTCIMLARTSNDGADEFQARLAQIHGDEIDQFGSTASRVTAGSNIDYYLMPNYQIVAGRVAHAWTSSQSRGVVAGATAPDELGCIADVVTRETLMLIPGVGSQGGDLAAVMHKLGRVNHRRFLINSSSGIIFADDPEQAAQTLHENIARQVG